MQSDPLAFTPELRYSGLALPILDSCDTMRIPPGSQWQPGFFTDLHGYRLFEPIANQGLPNAAIFSGRFN